MRFPIKSNDKEGQALLETIFILPTLIFIILLSFQIFKAIYGAEIAQEEARQTLLSQMNHRANGGIDIPAKQIITEPSPGIQTSGLPILGSESNKKIDVKVGICREVTCE